MRQKPIKDKTCRVCKGKFKPYSTTACVCSPRCALAYNATRKEKKERKENRAAKARLKTRGTHLAEAQAIFNKWVRLRDRADGCICCGKTPDSTDWMGGVWDCGHFLSRGAFPELRFNEDNAHKQLKSCNGGSGKYAKKGRTVSEGYKTNLIAKIGIDRVNALEAHHEPLKLSIDQIKEIKQKYKLKCKELEQP